MSDNVIFSNNIIAPSMENTIKAAEAIYNEIKGKEKIIALINGPIGAGKTTFTKTFASLLNKEIEITSPTYNLIHKYNNFIHCDFYRINNSEKEMIDIINYELAEISAHIHDFIMFIEWCTKDIIDQSYLEYKSLYYIDITQDSNIKIIKDQKI